jgi:hypothetical protein
VTSVAGHLKRDKRTVACHDLGHAQPEAVPEDQDRPLLRRKSPEAAVKLVAVVDGQELVCRGRCVRLEQDDIAAKCRLRRASA